MMWELVRANRRRSIILLAVMLVVLLLLGFLVGSALIPSVGATQFHDDTLHPGFAFDPTGGLIGMGVAAVLWLFQSAVAYFQGGSILLAISRARPIEKEDHPQLFNVVEEMTIAASLPKMPQIYIIDDMAMNAFAAGRDPDHAAVAVTAGLLGRLNRDQLQGVIAHEIAHIVNRDVLFMTMVGIMVGTIVMVSEIFLRSLWFGARTRRYSGNRKGNAGQLIILVVAVIFAVLAPILAQFIYFAISRRREYLADAGAAVFTRYPEGLAQALEVIGRDTTVLESANRATAPMYIINPLHKEGGMALNLTRTHPPLDDRVRVLRSLQGGVSYAAYATAMQTAGARNAATIPESGLHQPTLPIRDASPEAEEAPEQNQRERMREAGDLLRKINNYIFLACACGMRIKLPPEFKEDHVECPRCHREAKVPVAHLATAAAAGAMLGKNPEEAVVPLAVMRGALQNTPHAGGQPQAGAPTQTQPPTQPPEGGVPLATPRGAVQPPPVPIAPQKGKWTSIKCTCGAVKSIAPSFSGTHTTCSRCGRKMVVQ